MPGKVILFALVFNAIAYSQIGRHTSRMDAIIKSSIRGEPLVVWANELSQIENMGDSVALPIEEIADGNHTLTASQIKRMLAFIREAFVQPKAIVNVANRKPTATLALLDRLDMLTHDTGLLADINAAKQYVMTQSSDTAATRR